MVLNGIGGRTIAEAKRNVSIGEFELWQAYRLKRGSLNAGLRVEEGFAMLSWLYAESKRGKGSKSFTLHDFAPHIDPPETNTKNNEEIPLEAMFG